LKIKHGPMIPVPVAVAKNIKNVMVPWSEFNEASF